MDDLALTTDLRTKVVEKIKASFIEFIPDLEWDKLVQKEVALFIESELKVLIKAELTAFFQAEIKKELERPEFLDSGWGEHGNLPGEAVKQIIKDLTPDFISAMFGRIVQQSVSQIKNNLQNMY
jgi:hypothetical protein